RRPRSLGLPAARRSVMAQDDPVVSAQWLHEHLGMPDVKFRDILLLSPALVVLDASWYMPVENRDPWKEYQVAHIPGVLFFDLDGIVDRTTDLPHMLPSEEAFAAAISELDMKNQDKVIVYDGKGFFSAPRVWWMFRVFGHKKVWVLDGGLPQWRASGFNVENASPNNDTVLKSIAANRAVERVYNGEHINTISFRIEFQPNLFWALEKIEAGHISSSKNRRRLYSSVNPRSYGNDSDGDTTPRLSSRASHPPESCALFLCVTDICIEAPPFLFLCNLRSPTTGFVAFTVERPPVMD
ncbi:hypothetical protein ACJX0J_042007, partial [Zea mays]